MELSDLVKVKVIGFDLDNTLYPSTPEMQERIRGKIYEKLASGLNISVELAKDLFEENYNGNFPWSQSGSRTINELAKRYQKELNGKEVVQQGLEQADILDFIQPNPELRKMLFRLFGRFDLDLISGTSQDLAIGKIDKIGLTKDLFGYFFTGGEFGSKTDGTAFQYWLDKRKIPPNQMLYVGDNKKQDIDAPKRLGIRTCIVGKQYDNADFYIPTINDLESLFTS